MSYPAALNLVARPAPVAGAATVILVHGSLDRGESFRRVMRRLPELGVVLYDRRGYQGSRAGGVVDLGGHIDDLLGIAAEARASGGGGPVVAVGHSLGGDVVLGAALADPRALGAVGAYEPPMPWLGFRRERGAGGSGGGNGWRPIADDPARGGRALLLPHGEPRSLGAAHRRGPGPAPRRRACVGGRPARHTRRRASVRRGATQRAGRVRAGRTGDGAASPAQRAMAGRARAGRRGLRDRGGAPRRPPLAPRSLRRDDATRGGARGRTHPARRPRRRGSKPRRTAAARCRGVWCRDSGSGA